MINSKKKRPGGNMTERLYLNNPYLRQIDARIVEKVYKNNKYYIKTDKTIFFIQILLVDSLEIREL